MQKLQITLPQKKWSTILTKYPADSLFVLPDNFLGGSQNFDTYVSGVITKRPGGTTYNGTPLATPFKDQYEAIFTDGTHHLLVVEGGRLSYTSGGGSFAVVTSGYSANGNFEFALYQNRVYFDNGIDAPQVYDRSTTYGGVTYTAPQTKAAGAQAPGSAPVAALVTDSTVNQVPAGGHTYKVTFLYYGSEESNGGPVSNLVTNDATHTSNTVTLAIGGYGVTARKIYRDNNDGAWLLVGTVSDNTSTSFTDKASAGTSSVPTSNNIPPTYTLVVLWRDKLFFAGVPGNPSTLYYSNAGQPDIVGPNNFLLCNPKDPITGLAIYNDTVVILNRNSIGVLVGYTPDRFAYSAIPGIIGCVDNRTIQVVTKEGVPKLFWLSDKGVYSYNGNSINYESEDIEDQLNFNIQQSSQVKGKNTQSTASDFAGGTPSGGIITGPPITTRNPIRTWQSQTDWEGGSSILNARTRDANNVNALEVPVAFTPGYGDSGVSLSGLLVSSNNLTIGQGSQFTGEDHTTVSAFGGGANFPGQVFRAAQSIQPQVSGTITSISARIIAIAGINYRLMAWNNSGGQPGAAIYIGSTRTTSGTDATITDAVSLAVAANQTIWIGFEDLTTVAPNATVGAEPANANFSGFQSALWSLSGGAWTSISLGGGNPTNILAVGYTYLQSAVPASGTYVSQTLDSGTLTTASGMQLAITGTYPGSSFSTVFVDTSPDGLAWTNLNQYSSPSGTLSVTGTGMRYYRIRINLGTPDSRNVPTMNPYTFTFTNTTNWISEAIDCTVDVTSYDALVTNQTTPAGTSVTYTVATSADNVTYTTYGPIGSAVVQRYLKVQAALVANGTDTVTPAIISVQFTWTITANFQSSAINTGATPAGWELFQDTALANGGSVSFFVRTAASSGGLSSATYVAVTNGQFITASIFPFIQWKVVIVSHVNQVPTVSSVTINWFISITSSIRAASIFFNRGYYLSLAQFNSSVNNIMFVFDQDGEWRIYNNTSNFGAGTFSYFFNDPYYGDASNGTLVLFLKSNTDRGTNIPMDVRVALKFGKSVANDQDPKVKWLRKVRWTVLGQGGTYIPLYSVDEGNTWLPMQDTGSGLQTLTPPNDGRVYVFSTVPVYTDGVSFATGRSIWLRMTESTSKPSEIHAILADVWVRKMSDSVTSVPPVE